MSTEPSTSTSTSSAAAATTSSSAFGGPKITNHILSLPHPQFPYFLTQAVHLQSDSGGNSLFVHCTSISSTTARSLLPTHPTITTTSSDQDKAIEAELQAALTAAGRSNTPTPTSTPMGSLASDFALAMYNPHNTTTTTSASYKREPLSTPISTTTTSSATSSLATSMSKRIAFKLQLPQLYLSLDPPPGLLPVPGRIQSPEDSRALLALEKALRDACASALTL